METTSLDDFEQISSHSVTAVSPEFPRKAPLNQVSALRWLRNLKMGGALAFPPRHKLPVRMDGRAHGECSPRCLHTTGTMTIMSPLRTLLSLYHLSRLHPVFPQPAVMKQLLVRRSLFCTECCLPLHLENAKNSFLE